MLERHDLGEAGLRFVRGRISLLENPESSLVHKVKLEDGKVIAFLPIGTPFEKATDFDTAFFNYTPEELDARREEISGLCKVMEQKTADQIVSFLKATPTGCFVVEDGNRTASDPESLVIRSVVDERTFLFGKCLYYSLFSQDLGSVSLQQFLHQCQLDILVIGVLTSLATKVDLVRPRARWSSKLFRQIAENTKKMIFSAYDDQGYVIWTKPRE